MIKTNKHIFIPSTTEVSRFYSLDCLPSMRLAYKTYIKSYGITEKDLRKLPKNLDTITDLDKARSLLLELTS